MGRKTFRLSGSLLVLVALLLATVSPAHATFDPNAPGTTIGRVDTQLTITATGSGQAVQGFVAAPANPFDPATSPYPATNPSVGAGWSTHNVSFAGTIVAQPVSGGAQILLYCIDILTPTGIGYGYVYGTWYDGNVPNVGYVARLLNAYYPTTSLPSGLTDNQRAAAVQAAIWYFTDRYVVSTSNSVVRSAAAAIVSAVQAAGPLHTPDPPSLSISPTHSDGNAGTVVGPFTVSSTTTGATITVTAEHGTMYRDADGTTPIANGATVANGTQIWLRASSGSTQATLRARALATVPSGNVYLFNRNVQGVSEAQKLILARDAQLVTQVASSAYFHPDGGLTVRKTISGVAAGHQGVIHISVTCGGQELPEFTIAAGATGEHSQAYHDLPAGTVCTVTETADGHTSTVEATVTGDGRQVTIPSGGTVTVELTDHYTHAPGSLLVTKTISGGAAGHQGDLHIQAVCNDTPLTPDFVIPANTHAGDVRHAWSGIPAGASCTVTETDTGGTHTVHVTVTGSGQSVAVPAGGEAQATLRDDVEYIPGSLTVTKTIQGLSNPAQIVLQPSCNGEQLDPFTIAAGSTVGSTTSHTYHDIPAGSVCSVTETADGSSSTVYVTSTGGHAATVPPAGTATIALTDTYTQVTAGLVVEKNIGGAAAGSQSAITIEVSCTDGSNDTWTIPAGADAGTHVHVLDGIAAGVDCTITETADGSSSTVEVTATGSPQTVPIPAGGVAVELHDAYTFATGSLTVNKTITGAAAADRGEVRIEAICDGESVGTWTVPAGSGTVSHTFTGIPVSSPDGAQCVITEPATGASATAVVMITGDGRTLTVGPGATANADLTNHYDPLPAALVIVKRIAGERAGTQGPIRITVNCSGAGPIADVVIPTHQPAGTWTRVVTGTEADPYGGLPPGSTCRVTEISDGKTASTIVTATGADQQVSLSAAKTSTLQLADVYEPDLGIGGDSSQAGAGGGPELAATGTPTSLSPTLGLAMLLLLAGAGLLVIGVRRRA